MNIICFSNIDWGFIAQRHHHLMKCLKKEEGINEVIFVETLGTRSLQLNKEDFNRCLKKVFVKNKEVTSEVLDTGGVKVLKPRFIPLFNEITFKINKNILKAQVENICKELNIKIEDTVAWVMLPHPSIEYLVDSLNFKKVIYDCIDDVKSFPSVKEIIVKTEQNLIRKANCVTATSDNLLKMIKMYNENAYILKNGVSKNIILEDLVDENLNTGKKVINYIGTIYEWFDIDKIELLAKSRPNLIINIFGPVRIDVSNAEKFDNVNFKGVIPYVDVEKHIEAADVCIIPFKVNNLTLNTNPVKLYEYFAKGKPVVSINLPELKDFSNEAYLYNNDKEFINAIDLALLENDIKKRKIRIEKAKLNSWEERAKRILEIINL